MQATLRSFASSISKIPGILGQKDVFNYRSKATR